MSRFMTSNPVSVDHELSLQHLVDDYVYAHHHKMYPVFEDNRLIGAISTRAIKEVSRQQWGETSVRQIMQPLSKANAIDADADAMIALELMQKSGNSRLLVTRAGKLVGLIALKDLMELFALKMELE